MSAGAYFAQNAKLLAQNTLLQSALERQRMQSADLRSMLCSTEMPTICVCPALKLRLYTDAAGQLLGVGQAQIGLRLALSGPFDLGGKLLERIRAVLESGNAESQVVALASGQRILCRLLPLQAFGAAKPSIDGVIVTFAAINVSAVGVETSGLPDQSPEAPASLEDGGLAAGYPDLGCGLTRRQHQVLCHVLAGHPSKNIAADLGISRRTVENHRAAIMARTGATSLPALARLAIGADVRGDCKPATMRHLCD